MICSLKHTLWKWTYTVATDLARLGEESEIKEREESGSIRTTQETGNGYAVAVNQIWISKNI